MWCFFGFHLASRSRLWVQPQHAWYPCWSCHSLCGMYIIVSASRKTDMAIGPGRVSLFSLLCDLYIEIFLNSSFRAYQYSVANWKDHLRQASSHRLLDYAYAVTSRLGHRCAHDDPCDNICDPNRIIRCIEVYISNVIIIVSECWQNDRVKSL